MELAQTAEGPCSDVCALTMRPEPGLARISDFAEWRESRESIVIADGVTDPADLAAIARGMAAFGLKRLLLSGGTGIAARDNTFEAVSGLLTKRIDGFGEIFRYLSYDDVGAAAVLSRATAGVVSGKVVVAMPGALEAVRLAMNEILLPELGHMVFEVKKGI